MLLTVCLGVCLYRCKLPEIVSGRCTIVHRDVNYIGLGFHEMCKIFAVEEMYV